MKRQIILEEYEFINGELNIFLKSDDKYMKDSINENDFEEYILKTGKLEFFEDKWDGYSESHYTEEYIYDYYTWRDEYCEKNDIIDFIDYYYEKNKLPEVIQQ